MKTTSKKRKKEDDLKQKKILIPLKFRGKPFLGLAQLSKIFTYHLTPFNSVITKHQNPICVKPYYATVIGYLRDLDIKELCLIFRWEEENTNKS